MFFQAEDGIRDLTVTGVQTCALPICSVFRFHNRWHYFRQVGNPGSVEQVYVLYEYQSVIPQSLILHVHEHLVKKGVHWSALVRRRRRKMPWMRPRICSYL